MALLDEKRIVNEIEPVCLNTIAKLALEDIAGRAREKGVHLECRVPENLTPIPGSPKRLRRLFVNLLDNGIKFTPAGGTVTLGVTDDTALLRVDVTDTGNGIPPEYLPYIFEDYIRARQREFIPGAGLGLSIARRIVEAHGGRIAVVSPYCAEHSGTQFSCYLPKATVNENPA